MLARDLDQPVGVRGVPRADHQHEVAARGELLDGVLAVLRRVTDVVGAGPDHVREPLAQLADDAHRLVDRQRRLRDERDPVRVLDLEPLDVVLGLDEHDVLRRLAGGALDLLVALVPDQHDRVAVRGELARLDVDLGDQRAGRVDRVQAAALPRSRARTGRRRGRRTRRSRPRGPRSPPRRRSRRAARGSRPRACCGRSPCARRRAGRRGRAPSRPSARRGRRPRSSRAAPRAGSCGGPGAIGRSLEAAPVGRAGRFSVSRSLTHQYAWVIDRGGSAGAGDDRGQTSRSGDPGAVAASRDHGTADRRTPEGRLPDMCAPRRLPRRSRRAEHRRALHGCRACLRTRRVALRPGGGPSPWHPQGQAPAPEVATPGKRHVKGLRTRRSRLTGHTLWRGIPVTSVPRTLVDLAAELDEEDLARACHEAGVRHHTTPAQVEAVLARRPNAPGASTLRAMLRGDAHVVLSRLEKRFLSLLRAAGLPLPRTNRPAGAHRSTAAGPTSASRSSSTATATTDLGMRGSRTGSASARPHGDEFRRYTWRRMFEDPGPIRAELRSFCPADLRLLATDPDHEVRARRGLHVAGAVLRLDVERVPAAALAGEAVPRAPDVATTRPRPLPFRA